MKLNFAIRNKELHDEHAHVVLYWLSLRVGNKNSYGNVAS